MEYKDIVNARKSFLLDEDIHLIVEITPHPCKCYLCDRTIHKGELRLRIKKFNSSGHFNTKNKCRECAKESLHFEISMLKKVLERL